MRYYDLRLFVGGREVFPASLNRGRISSLLSNGTTNPAALNVELDVPIAAATFPAGNAYVRVWGIGLAEMGQGFNLNGADVELRVGMAKGLPLATADADAGQAGLAVKGSVLQAYGNWVGTAQTLDLILAPPTGTQGAPKNYVLSWRKGTTLAAALKNTFDAALPGTPQSISLTDNLVLGFDEVGFYPTLEALAAAVLRISKATVTRPDYRGVTVGMNGGAVYAFDATTLPKVKAIRYQDLLGQPTWIRPLEVQFKTPMRADVFVNDRVSLPKSTVVTTQAAFARFNDPTTFSGEFLVTEVHHYGNYRQPDAASWNTTFNAVQIPKGS